jgi:hypothetical protein
MSEHPERPMLVQLDDPGYYRLPIAREFVDLLPPRDGEAMRIRLHLGHATTLDLPLTQDSLVALAHSLAYLLPKAS